MTTETVGHIPEQTTLVPWNIFMRCRQQANRLKNAGL
jgi:hypothetical protein